MRVRVGCEFIYELAVPTPMLFLVRPRELGLHRLLAETRTIEPAISTHDFVDAFGNHLWRLSAPAGPLRLRYDALAEVPPAPDPLCAHLPPTPVGELPDDTLVYTLPSRYCPSDLIADDAVRLFATTPDGGARVQAICDWAHANIVYQTGSTSATSGYEAYQQRQGVCRDFAHIGILFCRALNIPARYVCGYLPDIAVPFDPTPMDFHAWFEAYVDGAWRTFDARHNFPRIGRVVVARGRDAVDAAFTTSYGLSQLTRMEVWAEEVAESVRLDPNAPHRTLLPP
jgi:transglutaminase-like putative cysteine protease